MEQGVRSIPDSRCELREEKEDFGGIHWRKRRRTTKGGSMRRTRKWGLGEEEEACTGGSLDLPVEEFAHRGERHWGGEAARE